MPERSGPVYVKAGFLPPCASVMVTFLMSLSDWRMLAMSYRRRMRVFMIASGSPMPWITLAAKSRLILALA